MGCSASVEPKPDSISAKKVGEYFVLDTRTDKSRDARWPQTPLDVSVMSQELWIDPDFPIESALKGCHIKDIADIVFMRPKEFAANARMFGEEISRDDVMQGDVWDSWFLAVLAGLANHPDMLKKIVLDEDYNPASPKYKGVVHFRLWQYSGWVHIYVDDLVPVRKVGEGYVPMVARSPNSDVMWVTLLEKAFAKMHGGYGNIHYTKKMHPSVMTVGQSFWHLSGGANSQCHQTADVKENSLLELFFKCEASLKDGHICTTRVPDESTNTRGLISGHDYTITGTATVMISTKSKNLFRIRPTYGHNPPKNPGIWIGDWSPGSRRWSEVNESTQKEHLVRDGETWISQQDFFKYFLDVWVCKFSPFIEDSSNQPPDMQTLIYGEWIKDKNAIEKNTVRKFQNPKYIMTITGSEALSLVPVVFELNTRYGEDSMSPDAKLDVYKMDKSFKESDISVYTHVTKSKSGKSLYNVEYEYFLNPGSYLLIPHNTKSGTGEFCIRIYSVEAYPCRYISKPLGKAMFRHNSSEVLTHRVQEDSELFFPGQWKIGANAGGQNPSKTFYSNPQYMIRLQDFCRVKISLLQERIMPEIPVNLVVFKITDSDPVPLDASFKSESNYSMLHKKSSMDRLSFQLTTIVSLPQGRYVIIPYTLQPNQERSYCLILEDIKVKEITVESYNIA